MLNEWIISCGDKPRVVFQPSSRPVDEDNSLHIEAGLARFISHILKQYSVTIKHDNNLIVDADIKWNSSNFLTIEAKKNIIIQKNAKFINSADGILYLKSGIQAKGGIGTVTFEGNKQVYMPKGKLYIYYNPKADQEAHKYHNPHNYMKHVESQQFISYMLINDINDLQDINLFLHGNYALSQSIDASPTKYWNNGKGFQPLKQEVYQQPSPFSGNFDGNKFSISHLFINRPEEKFVGLFGIAIGASDSEHTTISNLVLENAYINGGSYVGLVAGMSEFLDISTAVLLHNQLHGIEIAGGIVGTATQTNLANIFLDNVVEAKEYVGTIAGAIRNSEITNTTMNCEDLSCFGDVDTNSVKVLIQPIELSCNE